MSTVSCHRRRVAIDDGMSLGDGYLLIKPSRAFSPSISVHCCCSPGQDGRPIISSIATSKHRVLKNERRPSALTMVVRRPSDHHQAPYHDAVPILLSSSEMSLVHCAGDSLVPAWLTLDSLRSSILSYLCRFRRQPSHAARLRAPRQSREQPHRTPLSSPPHP